MNQSTDSEKTEGITEGIQKLRELKADNNCKQLKKDIHDEMDEIKLRMDIMKMKVDFYFDEFGEIQKIDKYIKLKLKLFDIIVCAFITYLFIGVLARLMVVFSPLGGKELIGLLWMIGVYSICAMQLFWG